MVYILYVYVEKLTYWGQARLARSFWCYVYLGYYSYMLSVKRGGKKHCQYKYQTENSLFPL